VAPRRILLAAVLAVVALAGACSDGTDQRIAVEQLPSTTTTTAPKPVEYRQLAWAKVPKVAVFQSPGAASPVGELTHPTWEGQPLALLAIGKQPEWLQVRLPVRPNGAVGWVKASDVDLDLVPEYRVLVELGARRLTLFKGDEVVMQELVGIGKPKTPTPTGSFYVDAMVKLTNPNTVWGPYQMSVSGFSPTLERFMGGPGQIALHGTNAPGLIPGEISNGCIRLKNAAITKLASLTGIGTPVDIVA
jgi:lipoprotein-anchoring transpeptidase ErfK/SrfK